MARNARNAHQTGRNIHNAGPILEQPATARAAAALTAVAAAAVGAVAAAAVGAVAAAAVGAVAPASAALQQRWQ